MTPSSAQARIPLPPVPDYKREPVLSTEVPYTNKQAQHARQTRSEADPGGPKGRRAQGPGQGRTQEEVGCLSSRSVPASHLRRPSMIPARWVLCETICEQNKVNMHTQAPCLFLHPPRLTLQGDFVEAFELRLCKDDPLSNCTSRRREADRGVWTKYVSVTEHQNLPCMSA